MRVIVIGFMIACISTLGATSVQALQATPSPVEHRSDVFVTAFLIGDSHTLDAIELYNETDEPRQIDGWQVHGLIAGTSACYLEIQSGGAYIPPKSYVTLSDPIVLTGQHVREYHQPCHEAVPIDSIQVRSGDGQIQETIHGVQRGAWSRDDVTMTYRDEDDAFTDNFEPISARAQPVLYANPWYLPVETANVQITEILPRSKDCPPDSIQLECGDYVKIHNPTSTNQQLDGLRLRLGHKGQSITTSNAISLRGSIQAGSYAVIHLKLDGSSLSITDSGGWVWFEDTYGLVQYDESITAYESASSQTKIGWAWAYDSADGAWKWTSTPTPYNQPSRFTVPPATDAVSTESDSDGLKPCAADQYRNPETNRCKKNTSSVSTLQPCVSNQYRNPETNRCRLLSSSTSSLTPCSAGQYRNPETNRCKSLTATTSALVPCEADEYRNPATNRCKKVASANSTLKPCAEGQERNPETNRCRKVSSASVLGMADFPVEPIADTGKAFMAWWALGGVLLLGAGYATWEWRNEIGKVMQKIVTRGKVE